MKDNIVHISDVKTYSECRRKWFLSSPMRMGMEPLEPYAPFFVGRVIHTALEDMYITGASLNVTTQRAIEVEAARMLLAGTPSQDVEDMVAEQLDLLYGMMEHYELWQSPEVSKRRNCRFDDHNLEFLEMESNFVVDLYNPEGKKSTVKFGGRFDGIVRLKDDGSLWLWETKTARSISELQTTLLFDQQATSYIYAAQQILGEPFVGVIYNIIRKKEPTSPSVLKDGTLTKRSNLDCTHFWYGKCVKEFHPSWTREAMLEEYGGVLQVLLDNEEKFFSRTAIRRTQSEIDEMAFILWYKGLEMSRKSTVIFPEAGWMGCRYCKFRNPCLTQSRGGDWQSVMDMAYRPREDRILRPFYIHGFVFTPLDEEQYLVFYKNETVVEPAMLLRDACNEVLDWISLAEVVPNEHGEFYHGPSTGDMVREFEERGIPWQKE